MYTIQATIQGTTEMSFSRHLPGKEDKETYDQYEERIWPKKMYTEDGFVAINAIAIKKGLENTATVLSESIPGKRGQKFNKLFKIATIPSKSLFVTNVPEGDATPVTLPCDAQGRANTGKVDRTFPVVAPGWKATVEFVVIDENISPEKFVDYLGKAGQINGIGRWRPERGGLNGRFKVTKHKVTQDK